MSYEVEKDKLAAEIIKAHFGEELSLFSAKLMKRAMPCTIRELLIDADYHKENILSFLGIMFQHNLLEIRENEDVESKIEISPIRAILRLLFPAFVNIFKEKFGLPGEKIASLFMQQGRMSEIAFRARVSAKHREESSEDKRKIYETFRLIIEEPDPLLEPCVSINIKSDDSVAFSINKLCTDSIDHIPLPKRKRGDHESFPSADMIYSLNYFRLIKEIYLSELRHYTTRRFVDDTAVHTVHKFLSSECTLWNEKTLDQMRIPKLASCAYLPAVDALEAQSSTVISHESSILESVSSEICYGFIVKQKQSPQEKPAFGLNVEELLKDVKENLIDTFIVQHYGAEGVRIFRLLKRHHFADEMTISDQCKIAPEISRSCLFEMKKIGFVQSQCVTCSPKDIYLWSPNMGQSLSYMSAGTLKTMRILFARMQALDQHETRKSEALSKKSLAHALNETMLMWFRICLM